MTVNTHTMTTRYTQTRLQSILFRMRRAITSIVTYLLVLAIIAKLIIVPYPDSFMHSVIVIAIVPPALFTLWLFLFNSGKSRIDEYYVEFDDHEIRYGHLASLDKLPWSDYQGYKIKGILNKRITLFSANRQMTFELDRFSKAQQVAILEALAERI